MYEGNISYSWWSADASKHEILIRTNFHPEATTLILEASIVNTYAKVWTRYCLKKGTLQYGYLVQDRIANNPHELVCLILYWKKPEGSSTYNLYAWPYRCNASGTHATRIRLIGISQVDLYDGNEWD